MFAVSGTDASDVIITFIATLPAIIAAVLMIGKRMKRVEGTVDGIKSDIKTNHGKKPFEYLEMISDVHKESLDNRLEILETKRLMVEHAEALAEHTRHDERNFNELKNIISNNAGEKN
jgi:hypothetical protein